MVVRNQLHSYKLSNQNFCVCLFLFNQFIYIGMSFSGNLSCPPAMFLQNSRQITSYNLGCFRQNKTYDLVDLSKVAVKVLCWIKVTLVELVG